MKLKGLYYLLIATWCIGFLACNRSPQQIHPVLILDEVPVMAQWTVLVDTLPGIIDMYDLSVNENDIMSVVVTCIDTTLKKGLHYLLNFEEEIERELLTMNGIELPSYFVNRSQYLRIESPGKLLLIGNVKLDSINEVRLMRNQYFSAGYPPVEFCGQIYTQTIDVQYELRDPQQNKKFYKHTKPILRLDSTLNIDGYFGTYPPDYPEKGVYAYHLSPCLYENNERLYFAFPGSKYIGWFHRDSSTTSSLEFASSFDVGYHPMDTADFMQISKAVQFQDTVSRYSQIGYSGLHDKIARIYSRHTPIHFNNNVFNVSVIVGSAQNGNVNREYLLTADRFKQTRMIFMEKGLLLLEYLENEEAETQIIFKLLNIYED